MDIPVIAAFPAAGAVVWLLFLTFVALRRQSQSEVVDENWLRTHLTEPPEVVRAQFLGEAEDPGIERFLRRLETQHKISISVEKRETPVSKALLREDDDDSPIVDYLVHLRLLVERDHLSKYERSVIDELMPDRREISSTDIQKVYEDDSFDPTDPLTSALDAVATEAKKRAATPWWIRLPIFAVYAAGMLMIGSVTYYDHVEPVAFFAAIFVSAAVVQIWPDIAARRAVSRSTSLGAIVLLIPLIILGAVYVAMHRYTQVPMTEKSSIGMTVAFLALYLRILAAAATLPYPELSRARQYFENELAANRTIRTEWMPYAAALGLRLKTQEPVEETWGRALTVF
jgi:hypothetical protein